MREILETIQVIATYIVCGTLALGFLYWQVKRLIKGQFSIFTILKYVLVFLGTFIIEFLICFIDEIFGGDSSSSGRSEKYLDTTSALTMGAELEDVYNYNMGDPGAKIKLRNIEPYIQKTKYF